jgi:2-carboxy-1,4-naphthoquinone phytyltransferase
VLSRLCLQIAVAAVLSCACSNDAFDAQTGVDSTKPESVVNLTGSRPLVLTVSLLFLAAGLSLLARFTTAAGDARVLAMLAFSIACGYVYQGPPFRSVSVWWWTVSVWWWTCACVMH